MEDEGEGLRKSQDSREKWRQWQMPQRGGEGEEEGRVGKVGGLKGFSSGFPNNIMEIFIILLQHCRSNEKNNVLLFLQYYHVNGNHKTIVLIKKTNS